MEITRYNTIEEYYLKNPSAKEDRLKGLIESTFEKQGYLETYTVEKNHKIGEAIFNFIERVREAQKTTEGSKLRF